MSAIVAIIGLAMLTLALQAIIETQGEALYQFRLYRIVQGIVVLLFAILLMSFYGGIGGSIIMTLAAFLRKQRLQRMTCKLISEANASSPPPS